MFCPDSVRFHLDRRNGEEDEAEHRKVTAIVGEKKVELRETPRAVTTFGGLAVFYEFLPQLCSRKAVRQYLSFRLTSPNAIDPLETLTAFYSR